MKEKDAFKKVGNARDYSYIKTIPPSAIMLCPWIQLAREPQRKTQRSAISSGWPSLFNGVCSTTHCIAAGSSPICFVISVSISPFRVLAHNQHMHEWDVSCRHVNRKTKVSCEKRARATDRGKHNLCESYAQSNPRHRFESWR